MSWHFYFLSRTQWLNVSGTYSLAIANGNPVMFKKIYISTQLGSFYILQWTEGTDLAVFVV